MDYEKAYKEALERARLLKDDPHTVIEIPKNTHVSEYIFPELRESEDVKIQKELIYWIRSLPDRIWRGHDKEDVITWLENQGEQKHAWSENDESYLSHVITAINSYYTDDIDSDGKGCENPWREELIRWIKSIKQTLKDKS